MQTHHIVVDKCMENYPAGVHVRCITDVHSDPYHTDQGVVLGTNFLLLEPVTVTYYHFGIDAPVSARPSEEQKTSLLNILTEIFENPADIQTWFPGLGVGCTYIRVNIDGGALHDVTMPESSTLSSDSSTPNRVNRCIHWLE